MKFRINWDALGISASLACAIHCALLPLLMTSLPVFGVEIIKNQQFELGMILLAFIIGAISLGHGFKRHHHSFKPLILFSIGIALLFVKQVTHAFELWLLLPAMVFIVSAHVNNYRSCRVHNHAHQDDCNH
jgi:uncharacterized membrane protein